MGHKLVALGTMALDSVRTPFGEVENALGGSATFFGVAASLFCKTGLISVIGDDFPDGHLKFLKGRGIDLEGVKKSVGQTFHWEGSYEFDMGQARTKRTDLNVLASFEPDIPKSYEKCDFLFLANIDPDIQLMVLDWIRPRYCLCDTMNYWMDSKRDSLERVFESVDGIIINEAEARQYCETPNLAAAGLKLSGMGKAKIIIKKGEHGALLFDGEDIYSSPAYPTTRVVDPTGAGDSFAGGAMGYLAKRDSIAISDFKKAVVYGTAAASYAVEGFSIDGIAKIKQEDIEKRYQRLRHMACFDHSP